ncbi:hypothetical protein [Desulfonema magnum]|uniref:Uncharacterized protein n=1 Tax=Desulfonema magnum TaxID=45655 RepID=A0A975BJZ6_9BACT|nr:hypothetical protein [Desulfonema magnum]QTA86751.1 Uncharacterized protein dnm_027750 [Desulfonema magnum]
MDPVNALILEPGSRQTYTDAISMPKIGGEAFLRRSIKKIYKLKRLSENKNRNKLLTCLFQIRKIPS